MTPPRIRVRPAPVVAPRVRVRVSLADQLCRLGEIVPGIRPDKWHGWPNGSCVDVAGGRIHKGRLITKDGKTHALRWNPFTKTYRYVLAHEHHHIALLAL